MVKTEPLFMESRIILDQQRSPNWHHYPVVLVIEEPRIAGPEWQRDLDGKTKAPHNLRFGYTGQPPTKQSADWDWDVNFPHGGVNCPNCGIGILEDGECSCEDITTNVFCGVFGLALIPFGLCMMFWRCPPQYQCTHCKKGFKDKDDDCC